jgi:GR25 family glycosyltransferase involved in LPS biosynthesis
LGAAGWRFYGITTSDDPARERHLRREFERHGVALDVHVGERAAEADGFSSPGLRGCFEGHLACLRKARRDGARVAVIAEDDVVVSRAFWRSVGSLASWLDEREWTLLHLGYLEHQSPARFDRVTSVDGPVAVGDGWELQGSHFYAVSAAGLDALIEDFERRLLPGGHRIAPDGVLNEFRRDHGLPMWLTLPNLAAQAPFVSGISPNGGRKEAILGKAPVARVLGMQRRLAQALATTIPSSIAVRRWNRRVERHRAPRRPKPWAALVVPAVEVEPLAYLGASLTG